VIPVEIRCFSARFATGFRMLYQQRCAFAFHQLFRSDSGVLEADAAAEFRDEKAAESALCGKARRCG
jgi:hypothetical protein